MIFPYYLLETEDQLTLEYIASKSLFFTPYTRFAIYNLPDMFYFNNPKQPWGSIKSLIEKYFIQYMRFGTLFTPKSMMV